MAQKTINPYFEHTQPNPTETKYTSTKGDCVIRAFANATDKTWLEAFDLLTAEARATYDVPNGKSCYEGLFKKLGYKQSSFPAIKGKKRMTVERFCKEHPKGRYMISLSNHLCAVVDGKVLDTWYRGDKCVYMCYTITEE